MVEEIIVIIVNILHKDEKDPNGNLYNYIWDIIQSENKDVLPIEERHYQKREI